MAQRRRLAGYLLAAAVVGCSDDVITLEPGDSGSETGSDAGSRCPRGSSDVRGSMTITYHSSLGVSMKPVDLAGEIFSALVLEEDGSFTTYPGVTSSEGSFAIPCVPDGSFYLWDGFLNRYFVTSQRAIERRFHALGRAGASASSGPSTILLFDIEGLEPWEPDDEIGMVATSQTEPQWVGLPSPFDGATVLRGYKTWHEGDSLIDASVGDRAAVFQMTPKVTPSGEERSIAKIFRTSSLTTIDGETTTVRGSFEAPTTRMLSIDLDPQDFASLLGPTADYWLEISSLPASATVRSSFVPDPYVLMLTPTSRVLKELAVPVLFDGDQMFADVHAKFYTVWGSYEFVAIGVPIGSSGSAGSTSIVLRPEIGPPKDLTLNDMDATRPLTHVGLTPTLRWNPPDLGHAARYVGVIYDLDEDPLSLISFETTANEFTLPPGVLDAGDYFIGLSARTDLENTFDSAQSSVFTELFSP